MNRHENVVCKGCGEVDFTGRCYRCLSCEDFNMCAACYDNDFTSPQHPFDHPVKCVLTPADVEVYFGGEYLNDPPQSYRCPYCKQWGYNESTFLEHVSAVHVGASTLLVSTMVTLFERQQAARLFLEDEQLTVFTEAAASRNIMMNHNEGSLDLYLEPLNPNGSYQNERPVVPLTFRMVKPGAVEVAPWVVEGNAITDSNNNQTFGSTNNQGFGSTNNQGFGSTNNQGFGSTNNQGFGSTNNQGFGSTNNQGFGSNNPLGFGSTNNQGFGSNNPLFGSNNNQGFASNSLGFGSNTNQGFGSNHNQGFGFSNNHGFGSNFLIPETVRRRSLLERARNRFNFDRPPLPLQQQQQQQQPQQQQQQQQQQSNNPQQQQHPMYAMPDIIRFNEPLPTSRSSRPAGFRGFPTPTNPTSSSSARSLPFGESFRRNFFPPSELIRNRAQRHRTPRVRMDTFPPPTGVRQVHMQRFRGEASNAPAVTTSPHNSTGSMQRIVEFTELANGVNDLITHNMLRTIEEEDAQQQQSTEEAKLLEQQERERYLCFPFLTTPSTSLYPPEEQILFVAKRAEFVAQLLASVLCEEQLELNVPSLAPPAAPNAVGPAERSVCPMQPIPKLRKRSTSEYAGAGDSELDLKHTTLHNTANI